ncbi:MAG: TRAP transporter small permease [Candidatus Competibacterales bacterium]
MSSHPEPAMDMEAEQRPFHWRDYGIEDYGVLVLFWLLAINVFAQFFSRYVLNSSLAWTEEVARHLLIGVAFLGAPMAMRLNSHIGVECFYHYMPQGFRRLLVLVVDGARVAFCSGCAWIAFELAGRTRSLMVSLPFPKSVIYYAVSVGFVLMALRALQLTVRHWRNGNGNGNGNGAGASSEAAP